MMNLNLLLAVQTRTALFLLTCFTASGLFAQSPYADFTSSFSPTGPVEVNDQFTMTVAVETSSPVSVAEIHLTFDPTYLEVVSITPVTSTLDQSVVPAAFDNSTGTIDYGAYTTAMPAPSTTFDLVNITFEALQLTSGTSINHVLTGFPVSIIAYAGDNVLDEASPTSIEIECLDSDDDGLCDTADPDDDNDGCEDGIDPAPLTASTDGDSDGFGADCDCNDGNDKVYPGAPEICDGLDNNCNGDIDTNDPGFIDNDSPNPDVANLPDITAECEVTSLTPPTATDNCSGSITGTSDATLPINTQGTTTIIWTYDDGNGNQSTQTQDVVIDDVTPPEEPVLEPWVDDCQVTATPPKVQDNCAGQVTASTEDPITYNEQGTYTITWLFDDGKGNSYTLDQQVVIEDNEAPEVFECPGNINVNNSPGTCSAVVNYDTPTFSDGCLGPASEGVLTQGLESGVPFPVGTTQVVYSLTDEGGNTTTCSFTVTVNDSEVPTVSCPSDFTVSADNNQCGAVVNYALPSGSDNCSGVTVTTGGNPPGSFFPVGTTTVTLTATDAAGNTAQCQFDVTVEDNIPPQFTNCPSPNIITDTDPGKCTAVVDFEINYTDNCPGGLVFDDSGNSYGPGDAFPLGSTNLSYSVTDAAGNTATCNFIVSVVDNEDPEFVTCPGDIVKNTSSGSCEEIPGYSEPTATDNCSSVSVARIEGPAPTELVGVGTTTVTYVATDGAGLIDTCSFTITIVDNQAPLVSSATPNQTVSCLSEVSSAGDLTANDNCAGEITVSPTETDNGGSGCAGDPLVITRTWTFDDGNGNVATATQEITIIDDIAPITPVAEVPVVYTCLANVPAPGERTATDNCSGAITVTGVDSDNGAAGCVGDTLFITRTWTFEDDCGNTSSYSRLIKVADDEAPTLASAPDNLNVQCEAPPAYADYAEFEAAGGLFTDNCSLNESSFSHGGDEVVDDGAQVNRTYEINDACGNTATFIQTILIDDTQDPTIACAEDESRAINTTDGTYEVNGTEFDPVSASDNCTIPGDLLVTHNAGTLSGISGTGDNTTLDGWEFPEGVHTITFTVEDQSGNSAQCEVQITVVSQELSGTVDINNSCLPLDVRIGIFDGSGNQVGSSFTSSLDASGNFNVGLSGVPAGTYTVKVKVVNYLEKEITGVNISGASSLPAILTGLIPGDIAGEPDDFEDNYVGAADLSLLLNHYNTTSGDANFLGRADLNCDGIINALDLSLLLYHYDTPPSGGGS